MDCKEFRNIVVDLFDKEVSPETRKACNEHISHCAECRDYYEDFLATADLLRPKHSPVSQKPIESNRNWMKILGGAKRQSRAAASFIGIILITGLAFAAYHLMWQSQRPAEEYRAEADSALFTLHSSLPPVRFDDVRLDSILAVVSAHYGTTTRFLSEEAKGMKFIMTWNPDSSLTSFIDGLNMFDRLQLTLSEDTIFVEIQEGKEDLK